MNRQYRDLEVKERLIFSVTSSVDPLIMRLMDKQVCYNIEMNSSGGDESSNTDQKGEVVKKTFIWGGGKKGDSETLGERSTPFSSIQS